MLRHDFRQPERCPCGPRKVGALLVHQDVDVPRGRALVIGAGGRVAGELSIPESPPSRRYVMPRWAACLIAAAICLVIAIVAAPYIPAPGDLIVALIGYIGAGVALIMAVVYLVQGSTRL